MEVLAHAAAAEEYRGLPEREQDAMDNAIAKLRALGDQPIRIAVLSRVRIDCASCGRGLATAPGVRFIGALVMWRSLGPSGQRPK